MSETIGFIGLGAMGRVMAENLLKAGFAVTVYNRTIEKTRELARKGAKVASTPAEVTMTATLIITMLADDAALEHVCLGADGLLAGMRPEHLHLSMSTVAPATTRRVAEAHAENGASFVAAPVFGRPEAAAAKKLWIVASGAAAAVERARPVFDALGQAVYTFGEKPESANVVKLCGNFMILSAIEAIGEALALAGKNDIDGDLMIEMFINTLFSAPVYKNYGPRIAAREFEPAGFALRLGLKDARLTLQTAEASGVTMPLAILMKERLEEGVRQGRGELDWSAVALGPSTQ